jgi:hypothetical protein
MRRWLRDWTMSSATSIDPASGPARRAGSAPPAERAASQAIEPWQFFLLSGMLAATAVVIVSTGQSAASIIVLSLTVVAASTVAMGAYRALVPLVRPDSITPPALVGGRPRAALEREKTLAVRAIKELEFDHAMGKIAPADYDDLSARLRSRAMGLMRQLDEASGFKSAIEEELQRRLATATRSPVSVAPSAAPSASSIPACAACGAVNDVDARFCKRCGQPLGSADVEDA